MLITDGKVLTMESAVYDPGYVEILDGKIAGVGPMEELNGAAFLEGKQRTNGVKEKQVLSVPGAWVMPGLIEAHAHIGITEETRGAIGDDCNEVSGPVQPWLRALDAVNPLDPAFHDSIMAGITSVMTGPGSANVVGGQFVFLKTQGRCIDQMVVKAPAAMKVAFGENPKTSYENQSKTPLTRMATAALLREELFKAKQYQKKKESGELTETDFRIEPWLPVLRREIPMKAHAHRADDILTAIRIAKEFDVDITLDHCTEGHLIAEEIAASGFPAIVGTDLTSRSKLEIENLNFKTNHILYEAGVTIAVTTDHPIALIEYLPLCAGLAVKHGLPMEEGLKALTINPARICRVEERVGSLVPGKDADIAIFTGNPMELFTKTLYTIIDGKIVYDAKQAGDVQA